jgi:hypothetical protein
MRMVTNRILVVAQKVISPTQTAMSYVGKRRVRLFAKWTLKKPMIRSNEILYIKHFVRKGSHKNGVAGYDIGTFVHYRWAYWDKNK